MLNGTPHKCSQKCCESAKFSTIKFAACCWRIWFTFPSAEAHEGISVYRYEISDDIENRQKCCWLSFTQRSLISVQLGSLFIVSPTSVVSFCCV